MILTSFRRVAPLMSATRHVRAHMQSTHNKPATEVHLPQRSDRRDASRDRILQFRFWDLMQPAQSRLRCTPHSASLSRLNHDTRVIVCNRRQFLHTVVQHSQRRPSSKCLRPSGVPKDVSNSVKHVTFHLELTDGVPAMS
jgi:hypothetical protein